MLQYIQVIHGIYYYQFLLIMSLCTTCVLSCEISRRLCLQKKSKPVSCLDQCSCFKKIYRGAETSSNWVDILHVSQHLDVFLSGDPVSQILVLIQMCAVVHDDIETVDMLLHALVFNFQLGLVAIVTDFSKAFNTSGRDKLLNESLKRDSLSYLWNLVQLFYLNPVPL